MKFSPGKAARTITADEVAEWFGNPTVARNAAAELWIICVWQMRTIYCAGTGTIVEIRHPSGVRIANSFTKNWYVVPDCPAAPMVIFVGA